MCRVVSLPNAEVKLVEKQNDADEMEDRVQQSDKLDDAKRVDEIGNKVIKWKSCSRRSYNNMIRSTKR